MSSVESKYLWRGLGENILRLFFVVYLFLSVFLLSGCLDHKIPEDSGSKERIQKLIDEHKVDPAHTARSPNKNADFVDHLNYAMVRNPEIQGLKQAVRVANADIESSTALLKPQVGGSSSLGGVSSDLSTGFVEAGAAVNISLTQMLFDGGVLVGGVKIAQVEAELARAKLATAVNRIGAEASNAWVNMWLAQGILDDSRSLSSEIQPYVTQLERMASSGFIDRSILDQVTSNLLDVEVKVDEADLAARVAMLEFEKHFPSVDTQGLELPTPLLINNPEKGPITQLVDIPAIEESALGVVLAEERVQMVRAKYSPEVQIQLGASSPMDPNDSTSGQAGILVKYDFFDGGAKDAELLRSEESLAKAKLTLEFVKENALQAIKTSRARVMHSRGALELAEKRLPIIDQQIKVAESQIQTGQVNVAKVFEAKIQRRDLTHQIRRERANLTISRFNLAAALGVLGNELDFINDRK